MSGNSRPLFLTLKSYADSIQKVLLKSGWRKLLDSRSSTSPSMSTVGPSAILSSKFWFSDVSFARPKDERPGWYLAFLLLLSMASAAIDVFSLPSLGVFTANNTGNLVFLAIAAGQINDSDIHPIAAITSLAASWFGSFWAGQLGHRVGRAKRWYVFADTALGATLAILCAGLYYRGTLHFRDGRTEYVTIALLVSRSHMTTKSNAHFANYTGVSTVIHNGNTKCDNRWYIVAEHNNDTCGYRCHVIVFQRSSLVRNTQPSERRAVCVYRSLLPRRFDRRLRIPLF